MRSSTNARVSRSADSAAGDTDDTDDDEEDDEPSVSPNSAAPAAANAITAGNLDDEEDSFVGVRFGDLGDTGRPRATRGVGFGMKEP